MATAIIRPMIRETSSRAVIRETAARGGKVIIPAFAIGRVEELLYWIRRLERERRIPVLPVYVDSPMASEALRFYIQRAHELDPDMRPSGKPGARDVSAFATARFQVIASPQQSKELTASRKTRHRHLVERHGHGRPRAAPPGGRAAGSEEHRARSSGSRPRARGAASSSRARPKCAFTARSVPVRARIAKLNSMSGHADRGEILRWLKTLPAPPRTPVPRARRARADGRAEGARSRASWDGTPTRRSTRRDGGAVRRREALPARARRRRGRRADLRRRLRSAVAAREAAGLAPLPRRAGRARHLLRPALRPQSRAARGARRHPHARARAAAGRRCARSAATRSCSGSTAAPTTASPRARACCASTPDAWVARGRGRGRRRRAAAARAPANRRAAWRSGWRPILFDAAVRPDPHQQVAGRRAATSCEASANNLYVGVSMRRPRRRSTSATALNSRLVKTAAGWSRRCTASAADTTARSAASSATSRTRSPLRRQPRPTALRALIRFYTTGEDADRVAYDIAWVRDQTRHGGHHQRLHRGVPRPARHQGRLGGHGVLRQPRAHAAHRDHGRARPVVRGPRARGSRAFRKPEVLGVTAKAIEVLIETGDSGPITPVGINLPNDQAHPRALRQQVGVARQRQRGLRALDARGDAHRVLVGRGRSRARRRAWGGFSRELTTEMHEVIGHGSGRMAPHVTQSPHELLKEQYSALEEARADLVALYFLPDPKLVELGLVPAEHAHEIVRTEYEQFTRGVLVQLRRVREGSAARGRPHAQPPADRQLAARPTPRPSRCGGATARPTYVMVDAEAFHAGVGVLLAEVQRIKSEGDYAAARGAHRSLRRALRPGAARRGRGARRRAAAAVVLGVRDAAAVAGAGRRRRHRDVEVSYPCDLEAQMLEYSRARRAQ